jgi:hypothetical protein
LRRSVSSTRVLAILPPVVETSLTTSALSRDTFSVQAAGADSHLPRVGGGGRVTGARVWGCPHLSARNTHRTTDGVAHQTSLRSRRTMMTRANSRTREAGCLFILPVTDTLGHISTQASPHAGLIEPPRAMARDGRIPGSRSDHGGESRAECQAFARRRRGLCRALSDGVCVDRSGPGRHRAAPHE